MNLRENETRVRHCYSTWSTSYYDDYYTEKAAYPPIHRDLIKSLVVGSDCQSMIDAGCGPASFLRDMAGCGVDLYGFDLTPEMVVEGQRIFGELGLPGDHVWEGSVTDASAFRPSHLGDSVRFDAAVCVGVLPHIPVDADTLVIENLRDAVRPGGLVIAEARNQLFSLFTMNRYSYDFMADELIRAEPLKAEANGERSQLDSALESFQNHFRMDLPPVRGGKEDEPGYDEVLSRTHNPLVLREQFESLGLQDVETLFYHYHCLPPMYEQAMPKFFRERSLKMEDPHDWRGHFMASAFLVVGRKA